MGFDTAVFLKAFKEIFGIGLENENEYSDRIKEYHKDI